MSEDPVAKQAVPIIGRVYACSPGPLHARMACANECSSDPQPHADLPWPELRECPRILELWPQDLGVLGLGFRGA